MQNKCAHLKRNNCCCPLSSLGIFILVHMMKNEPKRERENTESKTAWRPIVDYKYLLTHWTNIWVFAECKPQVFVYLPCDPMGSTLAETVEQSLLEPSHLPSILSTKLSIKRKNGKKRWSKNSRSIDKTNTKLVCINHNFRSLAFAMRTCCNDKFFRQISHRTAKHSTRQLNWIEIAHWAPNGFQFETETMFHVVTSIYKYANYRHNTTAILVWSVPGFMKNVTQKC